MGIALVILLPGCGGPDPGVERAVRARLASFAEALREGDREAFVQCYAVSNETERELVRATYALARSMLRLHEAVAAHHDEHVELFQRNADSPGPAMPTDNDWAEKARLTIDPGAGEAEGSVPGSAEPMQLVRTGGRWKVRLTPVGVDRPTRQWVESRAQLLRRMADAVDAVRQAKADHRAAPEQVRQALGERIAALMRETLERKPGE